jgi:hypothetical protein
MVVGRSSIGRLTDYPGHVMLCKLRYGYGQQSHIEKLEILHNWYSDLRAYLPMVFEKTPEKYARFAPMIAEANTQMERAWDIYDPMFEGLAQCNTEEKKFNRALRGIKELLDEITAESKIIQGMKLNEEALEV